MARCSRDIIGLFWQSAWFSVLFGYCTAGQEFCIIFMHVSKYMSFMYKKKLHLGFLHVDKARKVHFDRFTCLKCTDFGVHGELFLLSCQWLDCEGSLSRQHHSLPIANHVLLLFFDVSKHSLQWVTKRSSKVYLKSMWLRCLRYLWRWV